MRKLLLNVVWILAAFGLLAACAPKAIEIKPPEIAYGRDMCDRCGMIISEPRFASAIQLENGESLKFDDAGEMFAYYAANPDLKILAWWVHDFPSETWIDGKEAFYVQSKTLSTPMGSGIACFKEKAEAEKFAAERGGKVYSLEEIIKVQSGDHSMGG